MALKTVRVKVDDGAEANILPLDSFMTMFPHALNKHGYPKDGFLRGSRTNLECYDEWEADKSWQYQTETSALLGQVISRP